MKRFEEQDSSSLKKQKLDEMSEITNTNTNTNNTSTSSKTEEKKEDFFKPVGEAVAEVDNDEEMNTTVHPTGAEDAYGHPVQEVESLCMNCHKNGTTRLLLTSIPYFREIVIMSFECPHCGFKNSEVQPASSIQEKGSRYVLKIENKEDFNRQVVKSEWCICKFVELDLEIPASKGQLTTAEGLLSEMIDDLSMDQEKRKEIQPEIYEKIDQFIKKVRSYINADEGTLPLTLTIDDPSGNSWIEYVPGEATHKWAHAEYNRTPQQNVQLGLVSEDEVAQQELAKKQAKAAAIANSTSVSTAATGDSKQQQEDNGEENDNPRVTGFSTDHDDIENFANEVQTFHATCSSCFAPCETHMKVVNIPHFKDVIIMSTTCERCGYKSNEVKTGGAIPPHGRRVTLFVDDPEDLARDILKSESCGMKVPELNLDLTPGTLGGRFTTIEGLLTQVREELHSRVFQETSDSMAEETKTRWEEFFARLDSAIAGNIKFTIEMVDPLSASYIQNVYAPDDDPNMKIVDYERTEEENEDLGLTDMVV